MSQKWGSIGSRDKDKDRNVSLEFGNQWSQERLSLQFQRVAVVGLGTKREGQKQGREVKATYSRNFTWKGRKS